MDAREMLLGRWFSDPEDVESLQVHGRSVVEFEPDGVVMTLTHPGGFPRIVATRFRLDGSDVLIADESVGGEKRVAFRFTEDGKLVLGLGEGESRYLRQGDGGEEEER
ncbi:MAG: hypothetical protein ABI718_09935 [Acidobacteriota bacterium]